jgi:hypothetical protein
LKPERIRASRAEVRRKTIVVTSPANNKATPKAATIGHAVGAGNSILPGASARVFTRSEVIPAVLIVQ